jgi:RND family efflux transporter MFP subunit
MVGAALSSMLLLAACTSQAPTAAPAATAQPKATPAPPVSADQVRRGDIQQSLSYSGDIRAREQISVLPKAAGRIEQLLVDVGSHVKAGDTLAVLEQDSAEIAALQAQATLAGAQAKLATLQGGPRDEDVAAAQAALNQQQIRLQNMRSGGRAEDVKTAEAAVSAAEAKMQALQNGADDGVRQAQQSAVDADKAAVASAEAAFAALGGQNAATLQQAQSQVDSLDAQITTAQALINSADAALSNLTGSSAADLQAAQSAYDQAVSQLQVAQANQKQTFNPTQQSIEQAQAAVEQAQAQRSAAQANQTALEQSVAQPCADTVVNGIKVQSRNSTACNAAKDSADHAVEAAEAGVTSAQAQLDLLQRGGTPAQQTQVTAASDQAQAQVNTARARLDALRSGGVAAARAQADAQKQQAQGQLVQAQENMKVAQANLSAAKSGNLDAQVKNANSQVIAARERQKSDEARLEVIERGPTDEDIQQAQAGIDQANQQLQKARTPYTAYDLQQQEQAVAQAAAQLQKVRNPYTDQDLAAAQAAVDQAQAQLDLAQLGVRETTVTAPVDGVIADRLVSPGAMVSQQTPIVSLVPPALELVVNVEEAQLGQIAEGQPVQIEVPAFPKQPFEGTVKSISPTVDNKSRTAAVRVEPKDDDTRLRPGMFARLNIVTGQKQNALLVPKEAILNSGANSSPLVITIDDSGQVHRTPIKLGLQNDNTAEVVGGLDEGQLVATSSLNDLTDGDIVSPQVQRFTAQALTK